MATLLERFRASNPQWADLDDHLLREKAWEVASSRGYSDRAEFDARMASPRRPGEDWTPPPGHGATPEEWGGAASRPIDELRRRFPRYRDRPDDEVAQSLWLQHGMELKAEDGSPRYSDMESFKADFLGGKRLPTQTFGPGERKAPWASA